MAKDLKEALVNNPETKLGGAEKPRMDLGAHLEYIESLLERGGGGSGSGSVDLLKPILTEGKAPVPNTGYVEKIFFNTKLTTDEVDSIIANANLPFTDGSEAPMYFILGSEVGLVLVIIDFSSRPGEAGSSWAIANLSSETFFYASSSVAADFGIQAGWNASSFTSFDTGEVTVNGNLVDTVNNMDLGTANNLLTNLIYLPGSADSGETEVVKSLTGQYKIVEKNIELDAGMNNNYTYDFINNINEDTKEISVIKTIAVRSKEANIIEKTLTAYTNPNIRSIGESTFYRCELLTDINFPIVTKISNSAFSHCSKLVNVNIPLVTNIDYYAFYDCSSLVDVNFPLLTDASHDAFAFCTSLQSFTAPMLTSISGGMFSSCYFLKNVTFPEAIQIYGNAFSDNTRLTEVVVSKVNTIDNTAFKNCYSLVKLFISQTDSICKLNVSAFQNCSHILGKVNSDYNPDGLKDGYIYVPASLLSQYKVAENWINYASQIIGHEDLEAGAALPNYTTSSFTTQTWYSDEKLTTVVTSVATTGRYYCRLEA